MVWVLVHPGSGEWCVLVLCGIVCQMYSQLHVSCDLIYTGL